MKCIVLAADNKLRDELTNILQKIFPSPARDFDDPLLAFKYCFFNKIDAAFISPYLKHIDDVQFGKMLKEKRPDAKLIYLTDNEEDWQYIQSVFECGRLRSPITEAAVRERLMHG